MAKKANQFNKPVPNGREYIGVKLKVRYLGNNDPDNTENISGSYLKITGEMNVVYESASVVPPVPSLEATLYAGIQRYLDLGIEVVVTEFDVRVNELGVISKSG